MFDNWFSNKCVALVGPNGRALTGEALAAAEKALEKARKSGLTVWSDRNGFVNVKSRRFFAPVKSLLDERNNPIRICGRQVKLKANFCSKCGSPAPGSWWRCGGCGKHIGSESKTCPHCGKVQNPALRLDMADGNWQKSEHVFAERFEVTDIMPLLPKGLHIQQSQKALLLSSGCVVKILDAGSHEPGNLLPQGENNISEHSLVMVDAAEFVLPICVESIKTADNIECELHAAAVLQFDPAYAGNFMTNLMGSSLYLHNEEITSALAYDEIAHFILQNIDGGTREFCNKATAEQIFKDPEMKKMLEDYLADCLKRNLQAIGIKFNRLNEVEFESEIFDKFRNMAGSISNKQQEIKYMQQADKLADDAVRKEATNEYEMDDYMKQLAHENSIKDELRLQELEQVKASRSQKLEKAALAHENDLDDLQQVRQLDRDRTDAEFEQEILDLQNEREQLRKVKERLSALEAMKVEEKIQSINIEIERKKVAVEQESADKWLDIKLKKQASIKAQKISMVKELSGADLQAMLMVEEDPAKRQDLLRLYEQRMQASLTPELLLAAAAARGNVAAAEAMAKFSQEKLASVEQSKAENKGVFEEMLKMNERMFSKTVESMAKNSTDNATSISNIIK